jgi:putative transposase
MQVLMYKYRLYPTPAQEKLLFSVLRSCRHWYNMCLSERKLAWELEGRKVTKEQQEKTAIRYRKAFSKAKHVFSQTLQSVCDDLDKAFKAYFRRRDAGEIPGYPRFKSANRFHSFAFKQFGAGASLQGRRLKLFGIGRVRVRWHRQLEGKIKQVRILHSAGRWYACFACEQPDPKPLPPTGKNVGIDVGIEKLLTTSDGEHIENPKWYRQAERKLRIAQRSLSRKKKGSKNRKQALLHVQRLHEYIANTRRDFLNKIVHDLITRFDLIALENLRITNMVRNPHLAKSILDAGWGYFRQHLTNKAANAGRQIVLVNPAWTSRTCSCCGAEFPDFDLSVRWVECDCGLSLDRDHNAAINILNRAGQDVSVSANVEAPVHALFKNLRL